MALYFLHLRNGSDELLDSEGHEFADMDGVRRAVMVSVRDVMAGDLKDGLIDLRFRIDAENESGQVVYTLPFKHAVNIIPEAA